ncbi:putative DNA-binding protein [Actinacidiphila reveromycinica]|uniref:Putative DNA-binding protein n=1 Tax=Actinacidiphila reveromycinica TaxID=659352 RepID=A0A7U3URK7_9ACTN|nr:ComEA family DNA-binding protein [Streptomyces sp. SN-593]BBA97371.1 putative DNA-binding protein [Streptomyces sp. SN-593]
MDILHSPNSPDLLASLDPLVSPDPLGSPGSTRPLGPPSHPDRSGPPRAPRVRGRDRAAGAAAAAARDRTAAVFGAAREGPPGEGPPAEPPLGPPVAGAPVFGTGPLGRTRTWLLVRCGLELRTVLALAVVLAVAAGLAVQHYWSGRPRTVRIPAPPARLAAAAPSAAAPSSSPPAPPPKLTVDIAGKVAKPGVRRLPKGARVADALTAAGGPLPGTDTTALNLARPLTDGEQILVGVTPPPAGPGGATGPGGGTGGSAADGGLGADGGPVPPLHLNTATEPQLDALPGVGPVTAQRILTYRTQHGAFTSAQQLQQIPGIGPRKFATLQPLVAP